MTITEFPPTEQPRATCSICGKRRLVDSWWLPEKYAVDNYEFLTG
jgi:hypothetical protein